MQKDGQKDYWDRVAGKKVFTIEFSCREFKHFVSADAAILDFGCGYGRTLEQLTQEGFLHLSGCDISPAMIALARDKVPSSELKVNEAGHIPFADNTFDAVLLVAVLTSVTGNDEQLQLMSEIRRVLKDGGILYVGDFLLNSDERNLLRYREGAELFGTYGIFSLPEGAVLRHHDPVWLDELFSGFEIILYRESDHVTMNGHRSRGFYYFGRYSSS